MLPCAANIAHHLDSKSDNTVNCSLKKLKKTDSPNYNRLTVCHSSSCFLLVNCVLSAQQHFLCFVVVPGAPICLHCGPPIFFRCGALWLLFTQLHLLMARGVKLVRCGSWRYSLPPLRSVAVISYTVSDDVTMLAWL